MATNYSERIHVIDPKGDGKAPKGLGVGDIVVTLGGAYQIMDVNPDGTYKSGLVNKDITSKNHNGRYMGAVEAIKTGTLYAVNDKSAWDASYDIDIQDSIRQLGEAQRQSRIAGLESAMNSALSSLDTEQSALKGTFYNQRNQAAADADVGQYNFAQYMASRGMKGNAGAMPELYRNTGLLNRLGALGQQEAQANTDIENQRKTLRTNYQSDVQAVNADADAQALERYINQLNADRAYRMQEKQLLNQQEQAQRSGFNTMAYYDDYDKEIERVRGDGDPTNDWMIEQLRAAKNEKILAQQAAQVKADQQAFENQLKLSKTGSSGGGGGGGNTLTYSQVSSAMKNIYKTNLNPMGQLTDAGKQALYNYASNYGGSYAGALLSEYGLSGYKPKATPPPSQTMMSPLNTVYNEAISLRARGALPRQIEDYLLGQYDAGTISRDQMIAVAGAAGITLK